MLTNVADGGNTFSNPVAITLPIMFEQSVGGSADGDDYFSFTADADGTIDVSLTGLTADVDLHLYNEAGVRIASSRTGGTTDESFSFDIVSGTTYILGVTPNTSANSSYTVNILLDGSDGSDGSGSGDDGGSGGGTQTPVTVADGGDAFASPTALTLPVIFDQSVGGSSDPDDYFSFTAEDDGTIDVSLTGLSADVDLHLYNEAGVRIASSRTSGTVDESFSFDIVSGTTYILGVTPNSSANSDYRVSIALDGVEGVDPDSGGGTPDTGTGPLVEEGGDAFSAPHAIQAPVNFSQSVGGSSDPDDYFQITASESGPLVVTLTGLTADVDLHLYNAAGVRLASSRTSGTADEQFTFDVEEGTQYVLGVTPNTSSNSPYQVSMTLNGVDGYDGDVGDQGDDTGDDDGGTEELEPAVVADATLFPSVQLPGSVQFSQWVGLDHEASAFGVDSSVFTYVPDEDASVDITLSGLRENVDITVAEVDAAGVATTITSSSNSGTEDESVSFDVVSGMSYRITLSLPVFPASGETPYTMDFRVNGEEGYDGGYLAPRTYADLANNGPFSNQAPVAENDSLIILNNNGTGETYGGLNSTLSFFDLTINDGDVDLDTLTITSVQGDGNVTPEIDGFSINLTFPDANYSGPASFTYTLSDGNGGTDTGTVNLTVRADEDPADSVAPDAMDDTLVFDTRFLSIAIPAIDLLTNDLDQDGQDLEITSITDISHNGTGEVTATVNSDSITFNTSGGFTGTEITANYTVEDPDGNSDTATLTIQIPPTGQPSPNRDQAADNPYEISATNVRNIGDPDDSLLFSEFIGNVRADGTTDTVDYYRIDSDADQAVNISIGINTGTSTIGSSMLVEIVDIEDNVLTSQTVTTSTPFNALFNVSSDQVLFLRITATDPDPVFYNFNSDVIDPVTSTDLVDIPASGSSSSSQMAAYSVAPSDDDDAGVVVVDENALN